jgi:succinyl-diaminopimelate desuccinylase
MTDTLDLACELIRRNSITPEDAGCQALIAERLAACGFETEKMPFGEVENLWARRGTKTPLFAFAGHTDVVPTGPREEWHTDPFDPVIKDGYLYGRGAADMKSSIAAMVTACERFIQDKPEHNGSIAFLITSDEEGPAADGTVKVIETLTERNEKIDWCLIGEPSSQNRLGDIIKNGRRGSLNGYLQIHGQQGHVAYPHLSVNPIHEAAAAISELVATEWDNGNDHFPPTTFQISNINAGTGVENIIPGTMDVTFNLRFSTESTAESLQSQVEELLTRHGLDYQIEWKLSGQSFLTRPAELVAAISEAIEAVAGCKTTLSTGGGTSDGRFIAPAGSQVVELGPVNATIHKVNECVSTDDLEKLSTIYERILYNMLS